MAQIDNLTLDITADASKAITSLNNLATALGKLKSNLPTNAKLTNTSKGFKALTSEISKLSLSAKNLNRIKAIGQIGNALSKISSVSPANIRKSADNLDALQGAISHISDSGVDRIERLARAYERLGRANKNMGGLGNVRRITNATAQANTPISTTPITRGITNVTGGTGEVAEEVGRVALNLDFFGKVASKVAPLLAELRLGFKIFKTVMKFNPVIWGLKALTNAFKKIVTPILTFVNAIKRIAIYRAIRGILKSITQGLREGIQNLALYSKALEELDAHSANNVMSRYASEFLYFKNAVATAVIPILRALIPYVETAINAIIRFVNVLAQVGSAVFGTQYTKAKYFWVDYADSLDNANGRAKALKHQLAGFDELNNLTDNAGGSGSDKLLDASKMFEEALINPKIKNFVDDIVKKVQDGLTTIKTATQPYVDKLKSFFNDLKTKVLPNLKRIYENLKKIWKDLLKPILDEFLKGFFEGFADTSLTGVADALALVTDKVANFTDKLVELKDKAPTDKLKDLAHKIGEVTGKILGWYRPFTLAIGFVSDLKTKSTTLGTYFGTELAPKINNVKDKIELLAGKAKTLYDRFINLNEPTSTLSTKIHDFQMKVDNAYGKVLLLVNKMVDLRDKFVAVKNYLDTHKIFENGELNASNFKTILDDIKKIFEWLQKLGTIAIKFTLDLIGNGVGQKVAEVFDKVGATDVGKEIGEKIDKITGKDTNKEKAQLPTPASTGSGQYGGYGSLGEYQEAMRKKLKGYASGGFPTGDLFVANEKGAEMVGRIGSNTAVANNNQITEAIAQATYTAMSQALSENGGSVKIVVEGDGDKMFRIFQQKQREYGRQTGMA